MAQNPQVTDPDELDSAPFPTGRGLLEIAWQRKALFALGVVIALVLALLYYAQATPVYQSKAQVLVVKKRPDNVTGIDTRNLAIEDYVATHQTLITSQLIVERAMQKRNLATLECFAGKEDVTEALIRGLTVTRHKTTAAAASNVLDLAFRGTKSGECATVLNAVIDSYKEFLDETYRNISEDTLKLVTQARDVLQKDIAKQEEAYRKFRKESPLLLSRGKEGGNLSQERLINIESKWSALLIRKTEVRGYLAAIETALKDGGNREALLAMIVERPAGLEKEGQKANQSASLENLLLEEQKLLESRGEMHPEVETLRKRIELARSFLASPTAPWRKVTDRKGASGAADSVDLYHQYFRQQLKHIEVSERLLADLFRAEQETAKALSSYEIEDEGFRNDIARNQKLYDSIIKRLQDVDLVKDVGGYDARTISLPGVGKKVFPSVLLVFPAAILVGALVGFGLAYWAEITDRSFRSVEEVRSRLGLPVVGQIPYLKPADERLQQAMSNGHALDPMLCAYYRPKSAEAESYRGVRTALYFSTRGEGHKVIQITSPHSGDGKSLLTANLAISIAQSGKKVILIDADLRKPRIHKLFGLSAGLGLGSMITEETELKDAIQECGVPGLAVLPCGPIPPNPAELLTSPRFPEFLDRIRAQYDIVLVDTPPLLVVTDPSIVAARVDGVLLNIRLTKNGRPHAERAKDILDTLGAKILGVVVNDAEQRIVSAGYGYGYGYGYTNGYHDGEEGVNGQSQKGVEGGAEGIATTRLPASSEDGR